VRNCYIGREMLTLLYTFGHKAEAKAEGDLGAMLIRGKENPSPSHLGLSAVGIFTWVHRLN
jgi:hypothetical protein